MTRHEIEQAGANLRGANLRGANLQSADLQSADLRGADLAEAVLYYADLQGANLRGTNLTDADLCRADLQNADLTGANLRGANLFGADLRGAVGYDLRARRQAAADRLARGWRQHDLGTYLDDQGEVCALAAYRWAGAVPPPGVTWSEANDRPGQTREGMLNLMRLHEED